MGGGSAFNSSNFSNMVVLGEALQHNFRVIGFYHKFWVGIFVQAKFAKLVNSFGTIVLIAKMLDMLTGLLMH